MSSAPRAPAQCHACLRHEQLPRRKACSCHRETDVLLYLGTGRDHLDLRAITDVDAVIVGGEPFDEDLLVWWNFVARTRDEVSEAARQWNAEDPRFGRVTGYRVTGSRACGPPWERLGG